MGRMITCIYTGDCSCGHISLVVESYEYSGDGTFRLEINKVENEDGGPVVYVGKRYTLRGMESDNDATVWQLVAGGKTFNFLYDRDADILALLGDKCEKNSVSCILKRSI